MEMNNSINYKKFKKQIGQVNHFLITIIVGLDALQDNNKLTIRDDFSTSWNPENRDNSINRSREFARKAALSWVVDCLDSYLQNCNREPKLITDTDLIKEFDKAGLSVRNKYKEIIKFLDKKDSVLSAFADLAISWRNILIHSNANSSIDDSTRNILLKNTELIRKKFCNLDIKIMLDNFDKKGTPTFKEVTSLIKATIDFVNEVDQALIYNMDSDKYLNAVFNHFLDLQNNRGLFMAQLHNCSSEKQIHKVESIMKQFSILSIDKSEIESLLKSF